MNKHRWKNWLAVAMLTASFAVSGPVQAEPEVPGAKSFGQAPGLSQVLRPAPASKRPGAPYRIYAITFRGMTDVERGFQDYFAARRIPVEIVWRDLNRDPSRLPAFIQEIHATRPDVIYTWGTSVTLGIVGPHDATDRSRYINDIPVVFTLVAAPVAGKIVPDLTSSKRNVTGVFHVAPIEAQIQAMTSYRQFQTLGVLYTPTEQNSIVVMEELRKIARDRGFNLVERTFQLDANRKVTSEGAADLVRELKQAKVQWLYLPPDSFLGTQAREVIIPTAMEVGLPTFASTEQLMEAGALSGLVSDYRSVGEFTAFKVEQILVNKTPPAAIPIETLKRFSFQIRMQAAEKLKFPPPLQMLNYAELIKDEVTE